MEKDNLWEKYAALSDDKAKRRERKKRKRMPVSGKGVFEILKVKKPHQS